MTRLGQPASTYTCFSEQSGMTLTSGAGKAGDVEGAVSLGAMQTPSVTSLHSWDQVWAPVAACVDESPWTPT